MIPTQARVDSQNQFNAAANVAQDQLRRVLVDWIGRKAWKISGHGGAVAKLAAAVDSLSDAAGWNVGTMWPASRMVRKWNSVSAPATEYLVT